MNGFTLKYLLLLVAQILVWNYFNFTQFLTIAILPAMTGRTGFGISAHW